MVTWTFENDLLAGVSQAIEGAVAKDGLIKQPQPLLHCPVTGDNEA